MKTTKQQIDDLRRDVDTLRKGAGGSGSGSPGPQGPAGPAGATGATGPAGPTGANGAPGSAFANIDGGDPNSTYGGTSPLDGGTP